MSLFTSLNLDIFGLKQVDTVYLVSPTPPTILPGSFCNFPGVFPKV